MELAARGFQLKDVQRKEVKRCYLAFCPFNCREARNYHNYQGYLHDDSDSDVVCCCSIAEGPFYRGYYA